MTSADAKRTGMCSFLMGADAKRAGQWIKTSICHALGDDKHPHDSMIVTETVNNCN